REIRIARLHTRRSTIHCLCRAGVQMRLRRWRIRVFRLPSDGRATIPSGWKGNCEETNEIFWATPAGIAADAPDAATASAAVRAHAATHAPARSLHAQGSAVRRE